MMIPMLHLFDTPDWDFLKVEKLWKPGDNYAPTPDVAEYYRSKYAVANYLKPQSICEIGVRAGYSAASFLLAGHTTRYCGIDANNGSHGGRVGHSEYAAQVLPLHFPNVEITILLENSQKLTTLPGAPYDLVHVDGDHTYAGCYHDIMLALDSGCTWVLIDDFDFLRSVAVSTTDVIKQHGIKEAYNVWDDRYRGSLLIKNPAIK